MNRKMLGIAACAGLFVAGPMSGSALAAEDDGGLLVRTSIMNMFSDASSDGPLDLDVEDQLAVSVDGTYFLTPALSVNVLAAFFNVEVLSGGASLGSVGVVPPMVMLQLHLGDAESRLRPYIGAGVNYNIFHGETGALDDLDVEVQDTFGWAAQVGFNYMLTDTVAAHVDARYLRFDADVEVGANRALDDELNFRGWALSAGLGFWL